MKRSRLKCDATLSIWSNLLLFFFGVAFQSLKRDFGLLSVFWGIWLGNERNRVREKMGKKL